MKKLLIISLALQVVLVSCFLWSGSQADLAMDKSGLGNIEAFQHYSRIASLMFYLAIGLWLFVIAVTLVKNIFKTPTAQLSISIPPLFLIFGWGLAWFL